MHDNVIKQIHDARQRPHYTRRYYIRSWQQIRITVTFNCNINGNPNKDQLSMCFPCGPWRGYIMKASCSWNSDWESLKWYSKIWSWVLWDSDPRVTALARPRSNCTSKLQIHPLVREDAPHQATRNCQYRKKKGKIGRGSQVGAWQQDRLADWLSVVT
jgi:hypothetical protein